MSELLTTSLVLRSPEVWVEQHTMIRLVAGIACAELGDTASVQVPETLGLWPRRPTLYPHCIGSTLSSLFKMLDASFFSLPMLNFAVQGSLDFSGHAELELF